MASLAIIITLGYLAVVWAFRASFRELRSATWWFAMGFAILAGAIILRAMYWDVALPMMRLWYPKTAATWSEATRERMINIFFSLLKMSSFFCALKCRKALILASSGICGLGGETGCIPTRSGCCLGR